MSTPTPTATPALPTTASMAAGVTVVSNTGGTPTESLAGSATSTTVSPEAPKGVAELIKELERKRLELEAQIKQLRAESVTSFPATHSLIAATASSTPGVSSIGISSHNPRSTSIPTSTFSLASLSTLPAALQKLLGSGLNNPDLAHLCEQGRVFRTSHSPLMLERRQVTTDLLPHVFNADPEKVKAFFTTPATPKRLVLTKTSYREGYDSKKLNQFVCFRRWKRVSPLQAAALSLDNFLVLDLLSYIEKDETLRLQAAIQLQEVLNRKEVKVKAEGERVGSASATATTISSSSLSGPETKVKAKDKGKIEAEVEADLSLYQAPFKALLQAYNDYLSKYSKSDVDKLNRLWANVGECHRRLPAYGLQEFFDNKPFDPIPSFITSPARGARRYHNNMSLDLDVLGLKTFYGLYKDVVRGAALTRGTPAPVGGVEGWDLAACLDSTAINRLCELRQAELENIIKCLLKPGATITLRADESKTVIKPL